MGLVLVRAFLQTAECWLLVSSQGRKESQLALWPPLIYKGTNPNCRRRQWQPTPELLPGKSHGWRSLVGYSPWGRKESDMTERLHFHFSLSCIGEGNGNPLQCSCLENPRDGGAWGAAVYRVAQSRTRLKRLSSSSTPSVRALPSWPNYSQFISPNWSHWV